MEEKHFHIDYLCSIPDKSGIRTLARLKEIKNKKGNADCSFVQPIYLSSIASYSCNMHGYKDE